MQDIKVMKVNVSPEEAEQLKDTLKELMSKNAAATIIPDTAAEASVEFGSENPDDMAYDDYFEGYDEGFADAVRYLSILSDISAKQIKDLFGTTDIVEIMSQPDFRANCDLLIVKHTFTPGEILVEKNTGVKYMCVYDPETSINGEYSNAIRVSDHHFEITEHSRFDFVHFFKA